MPDPACDRTARVARRALGVSSALVRRARPDGDDAWGHAGDGPSEAPALDAVGRLAAEARAPVAIADVRDDPRVRDLPAVQHGVAALLGVPLVGPDGAVAAVLGVCDGRPRAWSDDDVATLADLAAMLTASTAASARADGAASEDQFRQLADAAPALLWVTDPEGMCTFLSRSWTDFTGQPMAEGLGVGWIDAVHPDDRETSRDAFLAASATRTAFRHDYRLRHRDGGYRWALDAGNPWFGDDGAFLGFVGSVTDIHDRTVAEAALREREARYRTLFESVTVGFCILEILYEGGVGVDYRFVETNPAFVEQTGLVDAVGRRAYELVPDLERSWVEKYAAVAETGAPLQFQSGSEAMGRVFDVYAVRVGGAESRRVALLFTDITERTRAERALRESAERKAALLDLLQRWRAMDDPAEILTAAAETVGRALGAHRAGFVERVDAGGDVEVGPSWTDGSLPPLRGPSREGGVGLASGVQAEVDAPILREGAWQAGLYVHHAEPREWTAAEVEFAREVAEQAWDALERARAVAALRTSEARFRAVLDATDAVVFTKDLDGRYTLVNRAWMAVLGGPTEGALGRTDAELFSPEVAAAVVANDRAVLAAGRPSQFDEVVEVGGEPRTYLSVKFPLLDADGRPYAVGGIASDITPLKRAEAALRESEARFRHLAEALPVIVHTSGPDGAPDYLNRRWYEYTGQPDDVPYAHARRTATHPADAPRLDALWARAIGEGRPFEAEVRIRRHDGAYRWFLTRVVPVVGPDGDVARWFGTSTDIHAAKAMAAELEGLVEARTAELARSNAELDQFAYVASHDLKAPLRAIDSLAAWIEEDAAAVLPPESARHLALLRGRAARMEGLLDGLLTYSRVGRADAAPERIDVAALVADAIALVAPPDGFSVRVEGDLPEVTAPRAMLALVFRNLIGNAIKHHGRPDGRVVISGRTNGPWAEFAVADDGAGIAPAYRERVFGMFQTLRPRDEVEGSGMGLAIVKKTVENQGGRIWLDPDVASGATFRFTWPRTSGG
ncbi:PAS domain S-box protein [Rubrivirga sp. IMCC45206]|uniref:PAS domain S-box protein n=1 Tax=Rubrivirga sp. IMCC45206 TaxID=3391614 RepID=UPI0039901559